MSVTGKQNTIHFSISTRMHRNYCGYYKFQEQREIYVPQWFYAKKNQGFSNPVKALK